MWTLVGALTAYHYNRESEYRKTLIDRRLDLVSSRIIAAYKDKTDIKPFLDFLSSYLYTSSLEEINVSVYDADGKLLHSIGIPIKNPNFGNLDETLKEGQPPTTSHLNNNLIYYYKTTMSDDGKISVHTAMPWTSSISKTLKVDDGIFYITLFVAIILSTLSAFFSTNFIINNIKILRVFARNANNPDFVFDENKLGDDELGDISRQIIKLYQQRDEALRQSEKEHAIAIHAIEEKGLIQQQLTSNINHELKTPIGIIRGYLETVLSTENIDPETRQKFLSKALMNVERLCSLLNDVSTMTRLDSGTANIPLTEVNIHNLAFTIHNDFKEAGTLNGMKFTLEMPLDCIVAANEALLGSAISNLIRNATIHSHGTEMGLKLLNESAQYYSFSFWDNGSGVSEEVIPHLFERFYRIDPGRSRKAGGGTGLGLPIVQSTINAMGGAIAVANRSKGGLEFTFTLKKVQRQPFSQTHV